MALPLFRPGTIAYDDIDVYVLRFLARDDMCSHVGGDNG